MRNLWRVSALSQPQPGTSPRRTRRAHHKRSSRGSILSARTTAPSSHQPTYRTDRDVTDTPTPTRLDRILDRNRLIAEARATLAAIDQARLAARVAPPSTERKPTP